MRRSGFAAGLGDALATMCEARACKRSGARPWPGAMCLNTAMMMAQLCYDLLMDHALEALEAVKNHTVNQALEDVVEATIYLQRSGL